MTEKIDVKKILDEFKPFKVTIPDLKRYWEDESTGVIIKRGQTVEISQRQFRSYELKIAIMRSNVLLKEKCRFAFKDQIIEASPGNNKNLIKILNKENGKFESEEIPEKKDYLSEMKNLTLKDNVASDLIYDEKDPLEIGVGIDYEPIKQ